MEAELSWIDGQPFWSLLELQQRGVVAAGRMLKHYTGGASPRVELCIRVLEGVVRVIDDAAGSSERSKPARIQGEAPPFKKPEHPFGADDEIKYFVVPKDACSGLLTGEKKRVTMERFPAGYCSTGGNGYRRVDAYKSYIGGDPFHDWPHPNRFWYVVYQTENVKRPETIPGEGPTPQRVTEDRLVVTGQELKAYLVSKAAMADEPLAEAQGESDQEEVKGAAAELQQFVEKIKEKTSAKGLSFNEGRMPPTGEQLKNALENLAASLGYVYWARPRSMSTFRRCTKEAGIAFAKGRPRESEQVEGNGTIAENFYAELFAEEINALRNGS